MTNQEESLSFDVVVVTRNRTDALNMSIPLILQQSRQPENFIVVDSSDDHEPIKSLVEELTKGWDGKVVIEHTDRPSITRQRNIAMRFVTSDVVIFPDDDSLWFPEVASKIMEVYEADKEGVIGAVGGRPVTDSPLEAESLEYKKSSKNVLKYAFQPTRNLIEERVFPKPLNLYADSKKAGLKAPGWLSNKNCEVVPNISGFRMSFRTELLRKFGFDEVMGSKVGYATHEDMEVSVQVWKHGYLVVAARDARIFHHKHPSPRAPAYSYGFCWLFNYMYIVKKHMEPNSKAWNATRRFLFYKLMLYKLVNDSVFRGAKDAWGAGKQLLNCPTDQFESVYTEICDKYLGQSK